MFITDSIESKIMREIDSISAMNKIKAINLGGITGSSGGQGAPPGGFTGQLAQKYVTYDTQELSTSASGTSLVSNLNRIRGGHALADDSIIQRHIASGVGTLIITDGSNLLEQVKKVKFHNSILTGTDTDCEVEIIAVTSGYYSLPDMTGHENEYLSNNGSVPIWNTSVGTVSSVFGRLGDVVATSGDYDHSQLTSIGTKTHAEIDSQLDSHILDYARHVPSGLGYGGALLSTDGANPLWVFPSGLGHTIQDNGADLPPRNNLNFINVTVTDNEANDSTDITITASGGGSVTFASLVEDHEATIDTKAVYPLGLPLRVINSGLIHNQPFGGDARGLYANDFQSQRGASDRVAIGDYSVIPGGRDNYTIAPYSVALGYSASALNYGEIVHAAGAFSTAGDAQGTIQLVARAEYDFSVDTGWQALWLDGTSVDSGAIAMSANSIKVLDILVCGATANLSDRAAYHIYAVVSYIGGVLSIDAETVTAIYETQPLWNVRIGDYSPVFTIEVTDGSDTQTVKWIATIRSANLAC